LSRPLATRDLPSDSLALSVPVLIELANLVVFYPAHSPQDPPCRLIDPMAESEPGPACFWNPHEQVLVPSACPPRILSLLLLVELQALPAALLALWLAPLLLKLFHLLPLAQRAQICSLDPKFLHHLPQPEFAVQSAPGGLQEKSSAHPVEHHCWR